ncbi:MAG: OmpA family protein [Alphaproteobacteria bacterium]|nr:OmpA family protein [Alphaproteobacteria bacterium]
MGAPKKKEVNADDWQGTYGDCVTLLLCFFVMLLAASKMDSVMFEQIRTGIARDLTNEKIDQPIQMLMADLQSDIQSMNLNNEALIGNDHMGIMLDLETDAFFDPGSAELKPDAIKIIKKMSATLREERYNMFKFEVQGHTDDTNVISEKYPSNWELSSARASSVARALIENGITKTRLRAVGMADIQPKYPNRDADGMPIPHNQRRNRRVVLRMDPVYN